MLPIFCVLCLFSASCVREEPRGHVPEDELPFGQVLEPKPGQPLGRALVIRGWALSEYGIQKVAIYEDRAFLADAKLGLTSPEAEKAQPGFPGVAHAGWRFEADPRIFSTGPHELTVQARSKTGAVRELASWNIIIGRPYGKMDSPRDGQQIAQPFSIRGWAISEQGLDQVAILIDGKFFATPRLGLERPDVQKAFPKARDGLTSGWRFDATPAMFTPGGHEIVARARSTDGVEHVLGTARITILR